MLVRVSKALMVLALSVLALLTTVNHVLDPAPLESALRGLFTLEAAPAAEPWRAVADARAWEFGVWGVIGINAAAGLAYLLGGLRLLQKRRAEAEAFQAAKAITFLGAFLQVLMWVVGALVVQGAWFRADPLAVPGPVLGFLTTIAIVILVMQPDAELEATRKPRRRPLGGPV